MQLPALTELQSATQRPVVWSPIPFSSQEIALDARAEDTLYHGTRGPGKSDCQLMRFRKRVGIGYGAYWRGIIFDREYKHLDDLITKSKKWFYAFNDGAEWQASTSALKWVWPTGEELLFRVIKIPDDYNNYHGHEYPFIGWNELTKYPTDTLYRMMMSCNRSSYLPEKDGPRDKNGKLTMSDPIPLETFSTCNSYGVGHGWVKGRFIDPAPYGQIITYKTRVFNPQTQKEEDIERRQVSIFGSYRENIYLDPLYIAGLNQACENDANLRAAWLEGSWDIVAGGALDDVWRRDVHIIRRFQVPKEWRINRTFDWGSSKPFSTGWWAEANGEEVEFADGSTWCPARGSLIQIAEYYGSKVLGSNVGLKLSSGDIAIEIKERERQMLTDEWILTQPMAGPADNQIRDVREADEETIEFKMAEKGIHWRESDKSPGSRRNGLELMRERFKNAIRKEGPGIYFMDNCRASIALLPILPRDEVKIDDVDTDAEDHAYDMVRYRVLQGVRKEAVKIPVKWVN